MDVTFQLGVDTTSRNFEGWKLHPFSGKFQQKNQLPFKWGYTPPKINIEPENDGLEDYSPFPGVYSQVPC